MDDQQQQKIDHDEQTRQLFEILNRVGQGLTTNEDKLVLATALGMSDFFKEKTT